MEHIWAPWRIQYIENKVPDKCILCHKPKGKDDAASYILFRGTHNYIMLNAYPYNPGHLMVVPYRHIDGIERMAPEERHEHFDIVSRASEVLGEVFKPGGFNIGINVMRVAGAGIGDHVHSHIVPRWLGDTNFMTVVADIRVIPDALAATFARLKGKF